eukprot:CAMPEP_0202901348 /NCGR_PEP_ID=MMETSP1392-20130828/14202_1 /ASSEMBLY_ACC=CAM_ASM_000868 /TAXON_ID=225041 /ORGANISM="Chlamydomonas chlamydogama, Strain SAG 11-48b" /LENGTH=73 /DNA_ID=CAMNT_0049587897 /DNA_START=939 /DNA_END=1157 /DNA_ORIENTATION=+
MRGVLNVLAGRRSSSVTDEPVHVTPVQVLVHGSVSDVQPTILASVHLPEETTERMVRSEVLAGGGEGGGGGGK